MNRWSARWQDIGLVLLALVAGMLVLVAFRAVQAPSGAAPGPAVADLSLATSTVDEAPATQEADDADVTTEPPAPSPLELAREVLQGEDPVVVLALGDSTGNDLGEWTYRWARSLAETRPTSISPWNEWTEDGYVEAEALSTAEGLGLEDGADRGAVLVLSGHQSGAAAAYPASRIEALVPEQPDLVILNFGHNNSVDDVAEGLDETLAALRDQVGDDVPVVVTLQQPQFADQNADVREVVAAWAEENDLPTIDVAARFQQEREDPGELLTDALHPNDEGSALWAEVVGEVLGAP